MTSDRRALAAIRFRDVTTRAIIREPLQVSAPDARFVRNRSGAYVITSAPGFAAYEETFEDIPAVEPVDVDITVQDPQRRYLARQVRLRLPRDPDPAHVDQPDSLFTIPDVDLYPSPVASRYPGWAVVRASARRPDGSALPFVLFRVRRASAAADAPPLAVGLSDERGEGMVAVSGLPVMSWEPPPDDDGGGGDATPAPLLSPDTDVVLEAYFDREAGSPPDPDQINLKRATLPHATRAFKLASGREVAVRVEIAAPL
jgi:hypothetical protein